MGLIADLRRGIDQKNIQIWLDADLHAAFREKLARDRRTMKDVLTRFIVVYSGYKGKVEDVQKTEAGS